MPEFDTYVLMILFRTAFPDMTLAEVNDAINRLIRAGFRVTNTKAMPKLINN
jgi:hypothetical protein